MTDKQERELDELLGTGRRSPDPAIDPLIGQADEVRKELSVLAPAAGRERALFVQGVGARSHPLLPLRFLMPAAAVVAAIAVLAGFGKSAMPGQTLYPVREALASVGLASSAEEEIHRRVDNARAELRTADGLLDDRPAAAQRLILAAIGDLQRARDLSGDLKGEERTDYLEEMSEMEGWAIEMLTAITLGPDDQTEILDEDDSDERLDEDEDQDEDNSGPGGGDDSGDDSSGSGSGDDDSSGSGSDDDSGGDDSSGSGSDDDSGGDDSSGSGSDDDSGGDSSGSGSDDFDGGDRSGSGSDDGGGGDSSGSGSGGDSDDD